MPVRSIMKEEQEIRRIHIRVKLGMIEIDDVEQQYRPDVDIYFYYHPSKEDREQDGWKEIASFEHFGGEFKNVDKGPDGDWPIWIPHIDFDSEIEEAISTDESFWINREGVIFGRKNIIPNIQNRFNTTAFPFDRQILNIELLSNNCLFLPWLIKNNCPSQLKLFYDEWQIQGELDALADTWDLSRVRMKLDADSKDVSSMASLFMYIARQPNYYAINISTMLFFIVLLIIFLPFYPYDTSRFDFTLNLVLTQIAYRFVTQGMLPQTGYLMYLDHYMMFGFAILITRFFLDAWLVMLLPVPEADPGDDFRCQWKVYYNDIKGRLLLRSWASEEFDNNCPSTEADSSYCDALPQLPRICNIDFWGTIGLLCTWILLWVLFLFPRLWRRSWHKVEQSIEDERLNTTVCFENGQWSAPDEALRIGNWLHKYSEKTSVESIGDLQAQVPLPTAFGTTGPEGGKNAAVWRGWTAPAEEYDDNLVNTDTDDDEPTVKSVSTIGYNA